mmetsp:Transcript_15896/g.52947  ORF Transcript_15896/g.52947 Transcript_15896/m.52947 type:complete len:236 (-) Transcript_15896:879-1586(-)
MLVVNRARTELLAPPPVVPPVLVARDPALRRAAFVPVAERRHAEAAGLRVLELDVVAHRAHKSLHIRLVLSPGLGRGVLPARVLRVLQEKGVPEHGVPVAAYRTLAQLLGGKALPGGGDARRRCLALGALVVGELCPQIWQQPCAKVARDKIFILAPYLGEPDRHVRLVGLQRWIVELLEGGVDQQHKRTASELVLERRRVSVALEMQQVARAALLRQVDAIRALAGAAAGVLHV